MATNYSTSQKSRVEEGSGRRGKSYSEIVDFLNACLPIEYSENALARMRQLDRLLGFVTKKTDIILVGGTNGKSSTISFASKLLTEDGCKVGASYSSNFLTYNERLTINSKNISNKQFTDIVGEIINVSEVNKIKATSFEILTMAALRYFEIEKVEVALLEVGVGGCFDATNACNPKISAITRIAHDHTDILGDDLEKVTYEMMGIAKKDCWIVSAEQSKIRLQKMKKWAEVNGAKWVMPIRKLSPLPYIFEQLFGRSASLAERIAQLYIENIKGRFSPFLRGNLLATKQGQRGRPTLEAKKQAEIEPVKTLKSFWNEQFDLPRGRFEVLDKEKPTVLLDNAHNIDAFENLFLGVRLLNYKRSINDLTLIMGLKNYHNLNEVMKLVRYLLKKINGQVFFVPAAKDDSCYSPEELAKVARSFGIIKSKPYKSFGEAFEIAKKIVDSRLGLIVVTGELSLISQYWNHKDIKKFN